MLEHSRQTYGPLPSELRSRRIRSRTSSRASPYPVRAIKSRASSEQSHVLSDDGTLESFEICKPFVSPARRAPVAPLQDTRFNPNIDPYPSSAFGVKSFSSFSIKVDDSVVQEKNGVPLQPRQRVASGVKRTAPSSKKRNTGKSSTSECKENMSQASIIKYVPLSVISSTMDTDKQFGNSPSDSLRISRPRPRGRIATTRAPGIRV